MKFKKEELQKISLQFRTVASRMLRTNFQDANDNLKRFLAYLESDQLVKSLLNDLPQIEVDYEAVLNKSNHRDPYEVPHDPFAEVVFILGFLRYISNSKHSYEQVAMGYGSGNKLQDHVDAFNKRVVTPLVSYIENSIAQLMIETCSNNTGTVNINVSGGSLGQLNVASGGSHVTANQNIESINLIVNYGQAAIESLKKDNISREEKEQVEELIEGIVSETKSEKPKKSIVIACKDHLIKAAGAISLGASTVEAINKLVTEVTKLFL
jgi:hypothetical protein